MSLKSILDYVKNHPSQKVKLALSDIDGILRGKYISAEKFQSVVKDDGLSGFCDVVFGWDAGDVAYDNTTYTGWHTGYPDAPIRIDLSTFRKIPWENDIPFFLAELARTDKHDPYACPRNLLRKVLGDATNAGFKPMCSLEYEWFNFAETPRSAADKAYRNLTPLTPGMFGYSILRSTLQNPFMTDLFDMLRRFDVPLEGLHTETGPGVYEAAITVTDALSAADRALLFKTAVKEIAYRHGIMATFMAKISESLPGCGGHIHQSLWDDAGKSNLFYDRKDKRGMSEIFKSYLAGQLHCLPELLPMYAPNVNSYKRLVEGTWAPTALTWGVDNRTVALRVIPGSSKSARLESRVPGSDINPYLAIAASLASGLYGIRKGLKLKQPETTGNAYRAANLQALPTTLKEATDRMKNSKIANEILGEKFVDHFTRTREWEWRQHLKAVTDWEYRRYFEII
ncbi:MAG: glutamine synthetase [Bacteroidota bacterium]|jgi:glutamine synthetase|nr:MAG: glutamine synthetase [Bacteroidota bacterium]